MGVVLSLLYDLLFFTYLNETRIRSLVAGVLIISTYSDPVGSNKTSLLLVMTIRYVTQKSEV